MKSKRRKPKPCKAAFEGLSMVMLLALLPALTLSTGCAPKKIVLHPIQGTDIVRVEKESDFKAPTKGYFISDFYLAEVMKAKVE